MKKIIMLITTVSFLLFSACSRTTDIPVNYELNLSNTEASTDVLIAGEQLSDEGNYREAIDLFTQAIEKDPDNVDLYLHRARASSALLQNNNVLELTDDEQSDYESACSDYNQAEDLDSNNASIYQEHADLLLHLGVYNGAVEVLERGAQNISSDELTERISTIRKMQDDAAFDPAWDMTFIHNLGYLVQYYSQWMDTTVADPNELSDVMLWYAFYNGKQSVNDPKGLSNIASVYAFKEEEIDSYFVKYLNFSDELLTFLKSDSSSDSMNEFAFYYQDGMYYIPCAIGFDTIGFKDLSVTFDGTYYNMFFDVISTYDGQYIKQVYVKALQKYDSENKPYLSVSQVINNWSDKPYADIYGCEIKPLYKIDVNADGINIRDTCSTKGNKIAIASSYSTFDAYDKTENENYIWYNIGLNRWIANNGSWISSLEVKTPQN